MEMRKVTPISNPRAVLKALTDTQHQALHTHPIALGMLNGSVQSLSIFLNAQHALLAHLASGVPCEFYPDFHLLDRALCQDIGAPATTETTGPITPAAYAGMAYVALGTLMGRKSILSALRHHHTAFPDAYLTAPMPIAWWRGTLNTLAIQAQDAASWEEVEKAAVAAFAYIKTQLDKGNVAR